MRPNLRLPINIADELAAYFATAESDFGVQSTFQAFVNMIVRGGPGGSANQEGQIRDERFGFKSGPRGTGCVGKARRVYAALREVPASTTVLYAAHGPTDWGRLIDSAFGRGMAAKVMKAIGPYPGVALLTETARRGWADAQTAPRKPEATPECLSARAVRKPAPCRWKDRPKAWENEGGWLVATVTAKDERVLKAIRKEVDAMLADAWAAYAHAHGARLESEAEQRQARRKKRAPSTVTRPERIAVGETPWS